MDWFNLFNNVFVLYILMLQCLRPPCIDALFCFLLLFLGILYYGLFALVFLAYYPFYNVQVIL